MAPHHHSVLLIDDDLAARESLEELLRQEGLDVVLAGDGADFGELGIGLVAACADA